MNEINIFNYSGNELLVINKEKILFDGTSIGNILGYSNISQAISKLDEDERTLIDMNKFLSNDCTNLKREKWFITEAGLYSLILSSRKPEAIEFKRWVTHEVLPSIRQTGSYVSKVPLKTLVEESSILTQWLQARGLSPNQSALSADRAILTYYGQSLIKLTGLNLLNEKQEALYTPTEIGYKFNVSPQIVNLKLLQLGLQEKEKISEVRWRWSPTVEGKKYSVLIDVNKGYGGSTTTQQLKWYESLLQYQPFVDSLTNQNCSELQQSNAVSS